MKIKHLLATSFVALTLASCENVKKPGGNEMATGSRTYYYCYVYSQITENRYYHIKGWAEYGPDGGTVNSTYVGVELQLVNGDVIYRYEPNLAYEFSKKYNPAYGEAIGD